MNTQKTCQISAEKIDFVNYVGTLPPKRREQIVQLIINERFRKEVKDEVQKNGVKKIKEIVKVNFEEDKGKAATPGNLIISKGRQVGYSELNKQMASNGFNELYMGEFISDFRSEKNSRDCVVTLLEKRNQFCRKHGIQTNMGFVLFIKETALDWLPALPKSEHYRPGVIAVAASGDSYIALGGNVIEGAKEWRSLQATKPTNQQTNKPTKEERKYYVPI